MLYSVASIEPFQLSPIIHGMMLTVVLPEAPPEPVFQAALEGGVVIAHFEKPVLMKLPIG